MPAQCVPNSSCATVPRSMAIRVRICGVSYNAHSRRRFSMMYPRFGSLVCAALKCKDADSSALPSASHTTMSVYAARCAEGMRLHAPAAAKIFSEAREIADTRRSTWSSGGGAAGGLLSSSAIFKSASSGWMLSRTAQQAPTKPPPMTVISKSIGVFALIPLQRSTARQSRNAARRAQRQLRQRALGQWIDVEHQHSQIA